MFDVHTTVTTDDPVIEAYLRRLPPAHRAEYRGEWAHENGEGTWAVSVEAALRCFDIYETATAA